MKTIALVSAPLAAILLMAAAHAENNFVTTTNRDAKATAAYWTPERFKAAQPLPAPLAAPGALREEPSAAVPGKVQQGQARAPGLRVPPPQLRLFTPDAGPGRGEGAVLEPGAVGTFGAFYTSSRVFPMFTGTAAPYSADRAYPYSAVGKLFFSINGRPFVCSAAAIQNRVVATAGHCVHSGTSSGFFSNWVFVPAFRDGTAPLLRWNWNAAGVPSTWAMGGGTVPNAADYGMIVFSDQPVSGQTRSVGFVAGWLGWHTLVLSGNHTSKLGYPVNLDGGQKMQIITSGAFRNTSPNNVEYGSDALAGSSGGPWVQNFQQRLVAEITGSSTGVNQVVGVTSYIYPSGTPQVQGASIPDQRWVDLLNALCGITTGNCIF